MSKTLFLTLIIALLIVPKANQTMAQEETAEQQRVAQFTFAYPLSINGNESPRYSNSFSFNVLYGVNGGLQLSSVNIALATFGAFRWVWNVFIPRSICHVPPLMTARCSAPDSDLPE